MPFTKNTIFRYNFKNDIGDEYSLYFVPSDSTDLSSPSTSELPIGCIMPEITLSYGFEDELPRGLALTKTLKFSVDRTLFTGDYLDVASWMFRNYSQRTVLDRNIIIPNHWYLFKGTRLIFDGYHDIKPSRKTEIEYNRDGSKKEIFEIECLDSFRVCSERTLITDLDKTTNTITKQVAVYDLVGSITPKILGGGEYELLLKSNTNIWNDVFTKINTISVALSRGLDIYSGDSNIGKYNNPFSNITFFRKGNLINASKDTALNLNSVYYCTEINNIDGDNMGGLLSANSENSWIKEYNNCWDLIKSAVETSQQKAIILNGFVGSGNGNRLAFVPMLENLLLDSNNIHYKTNKEITSVDIYGKSLTIEQGYKNIANASFVITDINKDLATDYEYQSQGVLNQESQDIKLFMNTSLHLPVSYADENNLSVERFYIRNLYYTGVTVNWKPDEDSTVATNLYACDIAINANMGNSYTITQTDVYPFDRPIYTINKPKNQPEPNAAYKKYIELANYTNFANGLGKLFVDVSFKLFEGDKQAMIEIELDDSKAMTGDVGDVYTFASGILPSELNTTAILTKCEWNIKEAKSKCNFFLLGDI